MNITIFSKALLLISLLAAASYTVGSHALATGETSSARPSSITYPAEQPVDAHIQTVIVSAKRLTPAEKTRMDEIENLLSTQNALVPKKHGKILT